MFEDLNNSKPYNSQGTSSALIKRWAIEHWQLPEDTTLLVSELQCGEKDCPDIETVIAILSTANTDKTVKINKPIYSISESDIKAINVWRNQDN